MSTYTATVESYPGSGINVSYNFTLDASNNASLTGFTQPSDIGGSLVIPSSVTDVTDNTKSGDVVIIGIGAQVFNGTTSPKWTLTIPNTVTHIENYAFKDCNGVIGTLTIPSSVTYLGSYAFSNLQSVTELYILPGLQTIQPNCFKDCYNITSITIPDSVTSVASNSFDSLDSLTTVYMKSTNTLIDPNTSATYASAIDNDPTTLVSFFGSGWTNVLLHEIIYLVGSIANYTFSGASNITVIALDDSVTSIGANAFAEMTSLTTVQVNSTNTAYGSQIGNTAFDIGGATVSVEQHLVCFDESTLILCPSGYVPVTNLKIGDSVVTYKHGNRKISRIRVTKIVLNEELPQNVNPYKKQGYAKHMFRMKKTGDMTDDLLVTGRHGILLDDLSSCSYFVDKVFDTKIDDKILLDVGLCSRFERETECKEYTIYQIELGDDLPRYGIYANGVLMESLLSVYE